MTETNPPKPTSPWCCRRRLTVGAAIVGAILVPALLVFISAFIRPTGFMVILGLSQGILVGLALRGIFSCHSTERGWKHTFSSIGGGVASTFAVYMFLYLREVFAVAQQAIPTTGGIILGMLGIGSRNPYAILSHFLTGPITGHGGFLGFILFRIAESPQFLNVMCCHLAVTVLFSWRIVVQRKRVRVQPITAG